MAFVPGEAFFPNGGHQNTFRMNFSAVPPDRSVEGVKRLAEVMGDYLSTLDRVPFEKGAGFEDMDLLESPAK